MIALDIPVYLDQKIADVSHDIGTTKNAFIIDAINFYFEHFNQEKMAQNDEQTYLSAPNVETLEAIAELNSGTLKSMTFEAFKQELRAISDA